MTPPTVPVLLCGHCGAIDVPKLRPGSGPHAAGAECQACGAFIKWLPKRLIQDTPATVSADERR